MSRQQDMDNEILDGILARQEKAIKILLEEYGGMINSIVCYHLRGVSALDREECINDILFAIWNHIDSFDSQKGTLKNWIAGVSKYKAFDCLRKKRTGNQEQSLEELQDREADFWTQTEQEEISDETEKLLAALKASDRQILLSLFIEDKTIQQIAKELDMKPATIYKRMERIRKKLRKEAGLRKEHK